MAISERKDMAEMDVLKTGDQRRFCLCRHDEAAATDKSAADDRDSFQLSPRLPTKN